LLGVDHVDTREYHGHIGDIIRIDATPCSRSTGAGCQSRQGRVVGRQRPPERDNKPVGHDGRKPKPDDWSIAVTLCEHLARAEMPVRKAPQMKPARTSRWKEGNSEITVDLGKKPPWTELAAALRAILLAILHDLTDGLALPSPECRTAIRCSTRRIADSCH
jgi:hypothetical protein